MEFKRRASIADVIRDLIYEHLEDEADTRDGLNALQEKEDVIDWKTFKKYHLGL